MKSHRNGGFFVSQVWLVFISESSVANRVGIFGMFFATGSEVGLSDQVSRSSSQQVSVDLRRDDFPGKTKSRSTFHGEESGPRRPAAPRPLNTSG